MTKFNTNCSSEKLTKHLLDNGFISLIDDADFKIVRCTNGVGEWEVQPTHETFDTREEAEKCLAYYKGKLIRLQMLEQGDTNE